MEIENMGNINNNLVKVLDISKSAITENVYIYITDSEVSGTIFSNCTFVDKVYLRVIKPKSLNEVYTDCRDVVEDIGSNDSDLYKSLFKNGGVPDFQASKIVIKDPILSHITFNKPVIIDVHYCKDINSIFKYCKFLVTPTIFKA